jgi:hypothetical protein
MKNLLQEEIHNLTEDSQRVQAIELITFTLAELHPALLEATDIDLKSKKHDEEQLALSLVPIASELLKGLEQLCMSKF